MKPSHQTHLDLDKPRDFNSAAERSRRLYAFPSPSSPRDTFPIRPSYNPSNPNTTALPPRAGGRGRGRGFPAAPLTQTQGQTRRANVHFHSPSVPLPLSPPSTSNPLYRAHAQIQPRADIWQPAHSQPLPILRSSNDATTVAEGEEARPSFDVTSSSFPMHRVHFSLPPRPPTLSPPTIQRQLPGFSLGVDQRIGQGQPIQTRGGEGRERGHRRGAGSGISFGHGNSSVAEAPPALAYPELENYYSNKKRGSDAFAFRVHSSTSYTQLKWTGESDSSGFFAPAPTFKYLTPKSYQAAYGGQEKGWLERRWYRQLMIDHILQRPTKSLPLSPFTASSAPRCKVENKVRIGPSAPTSSDEESSCWISTTRSIDWAIFDIARRLSQGTLKMVRLSVIELRSDSGFGGHHRERDPVEIAIEPWYPLLTFENRVVSPRKKQTAARARLLCGDSVETLFWGRVFSQNIQRDYIWTKEAIPFHLPVKFWKDSFSSTRSQSHSHSQSWLDELCWDPSRDNWTTALGKIREPKNWYWAEQPVHQYPSAWPPADLDIYKVPDTSSQNVAPGVEGKDETLVGEFVSEWTVIKQNRT